ncbi:MAG: peptidase U34 [Firmicutes bacterium]|nr:peptidase U34 [Bacillota bacterium]
MCDTMVALGNSTRCGRVIFAKNSDRQPNEPHLMIRVPRKRYPSGSQLQCTYLQIEQVEETYEVLLLKPSWMWGAEMGANEFGLNIGNEAVFTKVKQGPPALLGMDLLRLALERCRTSKEALHLLINLLEKYGQGGNCGYEKKFFYHNSFLIADPETAWVLETAGPYWAAQQVEDIYCISNRLSIGRDYDLAHPDLISNAIARKWCRSADDFHFADCYSNRLYSAASGSAQRVSSCQEQLEKAKGQITVETMFKILRSHRGKTERDPFRKASLKSICMHGGSIIGDHCTGSYAASLDQNLSTYWLTGSSTPCISIFKPYWLLENSPIFTQDEQEKALDFWLLRERLHRLVLENKVKNLEQYRKKSAQLERKALEQVRSLESGPDPRKQRQIMKTIWDREKELVQRTINQNKNNPGKIRGNLFFQQYWKKQTKKLGF